MTALLGGEACPLASTVQFVEAPVEDVIGDLRKTYGDVQPTGRPLPLAINALLPFQAPWSRLLVAPLGHWSAVVNNFVNGGDPTAPAPALARRLGVRAVIAAHVPRYGPGHQATSLEVLGPDGEPPLMSVRTISASATDGRWEWHALGEPLDFEQRDRYEARRVRDRFDRDLLLAYLGELGIDASDDSAYGSAVLLSERASYARREETLEVARALFA